MPKYILFLVGGHGDDGEHDNDGDISNGGDSSDTSRHGGNETLMVKADIYSLLVFLFAVSKTLFCCYGFIWCFSGYVTGGVLLIVLYFVFYWWHFTWCVTGG